MKIIALEFYKNGEMKETFALGGSLPKEQLDPNKLYPASLQNYLMDDGEDVILVDTGLPIETPDFKRQENQALYTGEKVNHFLDALKNAGYQPEDVTKILITHKHPDHSGELRQFPNAKVYLSRTEAEELKLSGENIIPLDFTDGAYENFSQSQLIKPGLRMIPAYGHTKGNSMAILETDGLYYVFHGDITYTDEALRKRALSVVFEDKEAAQETVEKMYSFVKTHPAIYLSTHTPEALTALAEKKTFKI